MYFYQAHPVRCYPDFAKQLEAQKNSVAVHAPIIYNDKKIIKEIYSENEDWITEAPIPRINAKGGIELAFGLFPNEYIKKTDYSFTLWQNPVNHVYDLYRYLYNQNQKDPILKKINKYFNIINNHTLESFVDFFIENEGKIIHKDGHKTVPEMIRISSMRKHSFVGAIEYIDDFIEKLEDNLKVKIYPTERMKYKEVKDNYRRSDLEKLLKDDVELFERKLP